MHLHLHNLLELLQPHNEKMMNDRNNIIFKKQQSYSSYKMDTEVPYIPCDVLFQNVPNMNMDLETLYACMAVNREWKNLLINSLDMNHTIRKYFSQYQDMAIHLIDIDRDSTCFRIPILAKYIRELLEQMPEKKDASYDFKKLLSLQNCSLFKYDNMTDDQAANTFKILIELINYNSIRSKLRSAHIISIGMYHLYKFIHTVFKENKIEKFCKNRAFIRIAISKADDFIQRYRESLREENEDICFPIYAKESKTPKEIKLHHKTLRMIRHVRRQLITHSKSIELETTHNM